MAAKIVFVQLGPARAKHLWANIRYLNSVFPDMEPVVVIDSKRHAWDLKTSGAKASLFWFDRKKQDQFPEQSSSLTFRSGFWKFTSERLTALQQWHDANKGELLLHVESDVMLLPSFPFELVASISKLAWPAVGPKHDVASVLFSPDAGKTKWLADKVLELMRTDPTLNDMLILNLIAAEHKSQIECLPIWHSSWGQTGLSDTASGQKNRIMNPNFPAGVFDGLSLGMWLTGEDPRNNFGKVILHKQFPWSYIEASSLQFHFESKTRSLRVRNSVGPEVDLYCLHVHSKDLLLISPRWDQRLSQLCSLASQGKEMSVDFKLLKGFTTWFERFIAMLTLSALRKAWATLQSPGGTRALLHKAKMAFLSETISGETDG